MADIKHTIFYVARSVLLAAVLITAGLAAGLDWLSGPSHAIGGAGGAGSNGSGSSNHEFNNLNGTFTGTIIAGLYGGGGGSHHGARITLKSGATMDLDDYLAMRNRTNMRSLNADQMTDCGGRGCSSEGKLPKKDRSATQPHDTKPKGNRAKNDLCGRCHK